MTQHSSLRSGRKAKRHRSVLKRFERIKQLEEKKEWTSKDSVFGLPKVKIVRFKIKKEKTAAAETTAAAASPGTETPALTPASAKEKESPKKEKEK